jgi:hypothetical protein
MLQFAEAGLISILAAGMIIFLHKKVKKAQEFSPMS